MTIYVDTLHSWGWVLRGRTTRSCHMFTDNPDLAELHAFAAQIGMKREWFQPHKVAPHYDLTPKRRAHAVQLGAVEVDRHNASRIWRARNAMINPPSSQDETQLSHA